MSFDARLRQGLTAIADPIEVDYDLALVRVVAISQQRARRNAIVAALAGAAAATALLLGGERIADSVLGIESPLPPAREGAVEEELEDGEIPAPGQEHQDRGRKLGLNETLALMAGSDRAARTESQADAPSGATRSGGGGGSSNGADGPGVPTERTQVVGYALTSDVPSPAVCDEFAPTGWACFSVRPEDTGVRIEIVDASGRPVAGRIEFSSRDRGIDPVEFCGQMDSSVALPEEVTSINVILTGARPGCSRGTNGEIVAHFLTAS